MIYFVIGLCFGLVVMAIICEKAHRAEINDLRQKSENERNLLDAQIKQLHDEIKTQRNVVKSLNEDNVKLRKKLSKKKNETDTGNS